MTTDALAPFTLPLRREGDAAIVDATGETVLVIDPDRHLENDEDAARLADRVLAMLTAAPVREEGGAVDDWRTIDSAPVGELVQVYWPCMALDDEGIMNGETLDREGHVSLSIRHSEKHCWEPDNVVEANGDWFGDDFEFGQPTHWRPRPSRPGAALATREESPAEDGKTCLCEGVEFGSYDAYVELVPPPWLERADGRGICVDACLALEITNLWKAGVRTTGCCCGHGRIEPTITVHPSSIADMERLGYVKTSVVDLPEAFTAKTGWPALRVQPQAREEAQPVAYEIVSYDVYSGSVWIPVNKADEYRAKYGCVLRPLYTTPPAPEAEKLRVAVEALEPFARAADGLDGLWSEDDWRWNDSVRSGVTVRDIRRARTALAALQQEGRP